MKKILVTGGLGYIGSHTVVELQNNGFQVVIIDNLSNSRIEVLESISKITSKKPVFYNLDICDKKALETFFSEEKNIDGVIHFAALKAVGESVEKPLLYYQNNVSAFINVLQAMQKHKIKNLIFSSSATVYGETNNLPIKETAPIQTATSTYGNSKQICEDIIQNTVKTQPISAVILRYFNPIGAHESALIGELPIGVPQNLIPYVTQTATGIRESLSIFGNDYPTNDGTAIRDYIHVVDLAKAHIAALQRLLDNKNETKAEVFNIGTGKGNSVLEVITTFEKINNLKLNYKFSERRHGDVTACYADTTLANNKLGWKAELNLEDALKSAWKWQQNLQND